MPSDSDISESGLTITQRYGIFTTCIIAGGIYYNRNDILGYAHRLRNIVTDSIRAQLALWSKRARHAMANQLDRAAAFLRGEQKQIQRTSANKARAHDDRRASSRSTIRPQVVAEPEPESEHKLAPCFLSSPPPLPTIAPISAPADNTITASLKVKKSKPSRRRHSNQPAPLPASLPSPPPTRAPSAAPSRSSSPSPPAPSSLQSQGSTHVLIPVGSVRSISVEAVKDEDEEDRGGKEDGEGRDEKEGDDEKGNVNREADAGWAVAVTKTAVKKAAKARREAEVEAEEEEAAAAAAEKSAKGAAEAGTEHHTEPVESDEDRSAEVSNAAREDAVLPKTEVTPAPKNVNGTEGSGLPTTPNPFAALPVSHAKTGKQNRRKKH